MSKNRETDPDNNALLVFTMNCLVKCMRFFRFFAQRLLILFDGKDYNCSGCISPLAVQYLAKIEDIHHQH